jgi:DNA invertase Pin-like site-specific DNA recombinase
MEIRAVGYIRVSTEDQGESGASLASQRMAIKREADRRGWELVEVLEDAGASARSLDKRPALDRTLRMLAGHHADVLVVAKLDRLTRSVRDFSELMSRSAKERWSWVALDLGVDTSTPTGEAMANVMATFAQLERRLIGQRTKDALAQKRAAGVRLGAPIAVSQELEEWIVAKRCAGWTLQSIAAALDNRGVPTLRGGPVWRHSTIRKILARNSTTARHA